MPVHDVTQSLEHTTTTKETTMKMIVCRSFSTAVLIKSKNKRQRGTLMNHIYQMMLIVLIDKQLQNGRPLDFASFISLDSQTRR